MQNKSRRMVLERLRELIHNNRLHALEEQRGTVTHMDHIDLDAEIEAWDEALRLVEAVLGGTNAHTENNNRRSIQDVEICQTRYRWESGYRHTDAPFGTEGISTYAAGIWGIIGEGGNTLEIQFEDDQGRIVGSVIPGPGTRIQWLQPEDRDWLDQERDRRLREARRRNDEPSEPNEPFSRDSRRKKREEET